MIASDLKERIVAGDRAALARALSEIEHLTEAGRELAAASASVEPRIIGWTGGAGAGKSTLISAVLAHRKSKSRRIAVLAVDPTSPYSGGSLLGDRIRMEDHALDESIYIRSLPARDQHRSLAPGTLRMARFLAFAGFEEVHVETVGAGQSEIEIAEISETAVVVVSPHSGDVIQGLKAGLLEAADILVVSKSDIESASATATSLENAVKPRGNWIPPVLMTSARTGDGIPKLSSELDRHVASLFSSGRREWIAESRRLFEFRRHFLDRVEKRIDEGEAFSAIVNEVRQGRRGAVDAADEIVRRLDLAVKP